MILAGDVGGTKTYVAVYTDEAGLRQPLAEEKVASADYGSAIELIADFVGRHKLTVDRVVLGVPGAVVNGRVKGTNIPWVVDERELVQALGLRAAHVLNDLEAIAYGVPLLDGDDLCVLNVGQHQPQRAIAVLAPGTGLGEGYLTWDGARYRAQGSEGGHADFAPLDDLQIGLLRYLWRKYEHVSFERACSGLAIPDIYAYLKESVYGGEPAWLAEQLAAAEDPTPLIIGAAQNPEADCRLCRATLDLFCQVLAAEAGNMACKFLPWSGVFIAGGIPPRILPALQTPRFLEIYAAKGRMREVVERIPLYVVLNTKVGVLGAAWYALTR
ncbi:MAG: glucokinase [Chloroflexi bacterium]|nr:glucokinase [Chloroflexota bacterium]